MFRITDNLTTHGLGEFVYPNNKMLEEGTLANTDFWIVDVRDMLDESQPLEVYDKKIEYALSCLEKHERFVICCGRAKAGSVP